MEGCYADLAELALVHATQLVFLARGAGPYTLAMGNATVKTANLPLSTLIPDYSAAKWAASGRAGGEWASAGRGAWRAAR